MEQLPIYKRKCLTLLTKSLKDLSMTTITAKIIADSVSENCPRLTTMELMYPRCIHGEFMTHRVFSRNASSSRAIPVNKQIQMIIDDPFVPIHWGVNEKGMQATTEAPDGVASHPSYGDYPVKELWLKARDEAVEMAKAFNESGYHKQLVNRLLEPFSHIKVVVTATEWDNFFELRLHKDAEPHMQLLAQAMKKAMDESTPKELGDDLWHLPYITQEDWDEYLYLSRYDTIEILRKISTSRCARVSYLTQDGKRSNHSDDIILFDRLVGSVPRHSSPTEHIASPMPYTSKNFDASLQGNLRQWKQFRKIIERGM
jgi:thymidylate synthase ThyX